MKKTFTAGYEENLHIKYQHMFISDHRYILSADCEENHHTNPFAAPGIKISGLNDTGTCLQTVYFPVLLSYNIYFHYAFWWKSFDMPVRKRGQEGFQILHFYGFQWHHGSEGVNYGHRFISDQSYQLQSNEAANAIQQDLRALSQLTQCHRPTVCEEGGRAETSVWMVLYAAVCTPVLTTATHCLPCYSGLGKACEALKRVWIVLVNTHVYLIVCSQHQS